MKNRNYGFYLLRHALAAGLLSLIVSPGCQRQKLDIKTSMRGQPAFDSSKSSSESSSASMSSSSSSDQQLSAQDDSTIAGSSVTVRPGALAVDSTVTLQEGAPVASQQTLDELGVGGNAVEAAAPAVIVSSSASADPAGSLLITIPAPAEENLGLTQDYSRLVVIYLIEIKKLGIVLSGIMPRSLLTVANGTVSFEAPHFGSFQAVLLKDAVAEKKEVKSTQSIKTKFGDVVVSSIPATVARPQVSTKPDLANAEKPVVGAESSDAVKDNEEESEAQPQEASAHVVSLRLKGGAAKTIDPSVGFAIEVSGPAKQMYISESSDCKGTGAWVEFNSTGSFVLSRGDGTKTVSAKVKNGDGVESGCLSSSIELVTPPNISAPASLEAVAYDRSVKLEWNQPSQVNEFLVIRIVSGDVDQPEHLKSYAVGDMLGNGKVVYKGSAYSFADEHASNGVKYKYLIYSVVSGHFYSSTWASATAVPFAGFTAVAAGETHTCAIVAAGDLYCWGGNADGQLGVGDVNPRSVPTKVDVSGLAADGDKRFIAVSAGYSHTCAISASGKGFCWGRGDNGRLGNNSSTTISRPGGPVAIPSGVPRFKEISAGFDHSCGITETGSVYCWGSNSHGQLGNGDEILTPSVVGVTYNAASEYLTVSAGRKSTCAVASGHILKCWGSDTDLLAGNNTTSNIIYPANTYHSVAATYKTLPQSGRALHWCAIRTNNVAACWGRGSAGRLGQNSEDDKSTPLPVTTVYLSELADRPFVGIAVTSSSSCSLTAKGEVFCWGSYQNGKLGTGAAVANVKTPQKIQQSGFRDGERFVQITGGAEHVCGLTSRGQIYCWGSNGGVNGTLGVGSTEDFVFNQFSQPVVTEGIQSKSRFISIDYGVAHACGVRSDGTGLCWGDQGGGRLGNGETSPGNVKSPVPVRILPGSGGSSQFRHISAGGSHSCGLTADGKAWCWGSDADGQIGDGSSNSSPGSPAAVTSLTDNHAFTRVEAGGDFSCGIAATGGVFCWGASGSSSDVPSLAFSHATVDLSTGNQHACLVKYTGSAYCWGRNIEGQLGIGNFTSKSSPVELDAGSYVTVSAGGTVTCGLKPDGGVDCWGENQNSPATVGFNIGVSVKKVTAGDAHKCALSGEGKAYCWGAGSRGQLGNESLADSAAPTPVNTGALGTPSEFITLAAGGDSTGGTLADGRTFVWGLNSNGQLGDGTTEGSNKPKPMAPSTIPPVSPVTP